MLYVPASSEEASKVAASSKPGKVITHDFKITTEFESISTRGLLDVIIKQSENPTDWGVTGTIPENFVDKFDIEVVNKTLYISLKPGVHFLNFPNECVINVVTKNLYSL